MKAQGAPWRKPFAATRQPFAALLETAGNCARPLGDGLVRVLRPMGLNEDAVDVFEVQRY